MDISGAVAALRLRWGPAFKGESLTFVAASKTFHVEGRGIEPRKYFIQIRVYFSSTPTFYLPSYKGTHKIKKMSRLYFTV